MNIGKRKTTKKILTEEIARKFDEVIQLINKMPEQGSLPTLKHQRDRGKEFEKWYSKTCKNGCSFCERCEEEFKKIIS